MNIGGKSGKRTIILIIAGVPHWPEAGRFSRRSNNSDESKSIKALQYHGTICRHHEMRLIFLLIPVFMIIV